LTKNDQKARFWRSKTSSLQVQKRLFKKSRVIWGLLMDQKPHF